jgi:hypothetical protein
MDNFEQSDIEYIYEWLNGRSVVTEWTRGW